MLHIKLHNQALNIYLLLNEKKPWEAARQLSNGWEKTLHNLFSTGHSPVQKTASVGCFSTCGWKDGG